LQATALKSLRGTELCLVWWSWQRHGPVWLTGRLEQFALNALAQAGVAPKFLSADSTAAAVAMGFSMGNKCVPSSHMTRPLETLSVKSEPTKRISLERVPPTKATPHFKG
jgi:hypothetical protein